MFFGLFKKKTVKATIDSSSQSFMLRAKMEQARLSHDQTVIADIPHVRIREEGGKPVLYFCQIQPLIIHEQINPGDGKEIPVNVTLNNVRIPKELFKKNMDRYVNIKNVKLYSNGTMQVIANSKTEYKMV